MNRNGHPEIDPELLLIATHELGHAIVWKAGGLHIKSIRVRKGWCSNSAVELDLGKTTWTPETGRIYLVGMLAGREADAYWCEITGQRHNERHSADDMAAFHRYRRQTTWAKGTPERPFRAEARAAVQEHWSTIERLAPQLASRGTVAL